MMRNGRYRNRFPVEFEPSLERSDHLEAKRDRIEHECVDELKHILFDNSAELSAVERRVLTARFSLDQPNAKPGLRRKTLDQVGDLLGVSSSDLNGRWVHVTAVFVNGKPTPCNTELYIDGVQRRLTQVVSPLNPGDSGGAARNVAASARIGGAPYPFLRPRRAFTSAFT